MAWKDYGVDQRDIFESSEYRHIAKYYGRRVAARSQLPLINHIHEGIAILEEIGACLDTQKAFCLHPLLQSELDLVENYRDMRIHSTLAVVLAMEYRNIANQHLCNKYTDHKSILELPTSPLEQIKHMLIADKIQNRKDFMEHHYGTHDRSDQLFKYFNMWIRHLGITSDAEIEHLTRVCNNARRPT